MLQLLPPPPATGGVVDLDPDQARVVAHRGPALTVTGGPGSGKTTVVAEIVAARVAAGELRAEECLVLAPTRRAAARLREHVTLRVGATTGEPLARTPHSFAFGILRRAAAADGDSAPRLITGPEQDVILGDLLAGHARARARADRSAAQEPEVEAEVEVEAEEGPGGAPGRDGGLTDGDDVADREGGAVPVWPADLRLALPTRTFRSELRDLLMRAVELDLEPEDLAVLGARHDRPEWTAAAVVLEEYDQVTALSTPGAMDPAWIVGAAANRLEGDDAALREVARTIRLVVVDDAQDLTAAAVRLLRVLARAGVAVILLADPDQATQSFRGGDPQLVARAFPDGDFLTLTAGHRLSGRVARAASAITGYIGSTGLVEHRLMQPAQPAEVGASLGVHLFRTGAQEATWLADHLRRAHLLSGVPWSQMAVVVRGGARAATLERVFRTSGIPVVERSSDSALRDDPAVRPFLVLLTVVLGRPIVPTEASGDGPDDGSTMPGEGGPPVASLDPAAALDVLHSRLGGVDSVTLRRLRRTLRRQELAAGGARPSDLLLVAAIEDPTLLLPCGPEGEGARRVARTLAAGQAAAQAPGATIETILWAMWSRSGLEQPWREAALAGGRAGRLADRGLDAVVALFEAAARYVERLPGSTPQAFLDHLQSQELAADTIAARAPMGEAVEIVTPADAAGREWDVVAVAGVQEGVWPDLRLRGQLLGAHDLVDAVMGRSGDRRAARAAVRHDETRLFHVALSRARRQCLVSAVRSEDEQPSVLLDLIDPTPGLQEGRPFTEAPRPLSLAGAVAGLRREVVSAGADHRGRAVTQLRRLAERGVRGADPRSWWTLTELSDDRPRRREDQVVTVSPSRLDRFSACPLQWFLSGCGAQGPSVGASQIGSLVHEVANDLGDVAASVYVAEVRERWPRLGLGTSWVSHRDLARVEEMVGHLAEHVDAAMAQGWVRHGSEMVVTADVGRARITGRVDRVEEAPDGRLRIIDLKTGASKPTVADLQRHGQLGAYQVAVDAGALGADRHSGGAALLQLGRAHSARTPLQVQAPLAEDPEPDWARERLATDAEVMAGARFAAAPGGGLCGTCAVQSSCPARPEGRRLV